MPLSPAVIVVSGHMVDAPGRDSPRFTGEEVPRVTAEIHAALESWNVGPGTVLICGGARGTDVIAAEQALDRGAKLVLVLALAVEAFTRRSVALPGTDWEGRFRRLLDRAEIEILDGSADEGILERANVRMIEKARAVDDNPHAIIVWNGQGGDGRGGTRDFVRRLGPRGLEDRVRVIDPTHRAYEARQAPTVPKKLLALDGGGIRGVLSLEILAALEAKLRTHYGRDDYVLADYFDYIGGTSTGAIIAAAVALGKPVPDIRRKYEQLGARVFRKRFLPLQLRSLYRDRALTTELASFFGSRRTLGDPDLRSLLLVVLHNSVTDSVWPLSNCTQAKYNRAERYLKDPSDRNLDLPLVTLIRGSTAAPVYFPPQELQVGSNKFAFQDGGVTPFNNPAMLMFLMATLPEYELCWPAGEHQLLIASVGTGSAPAAHPGLLARNVHVGFQAKNLPSVFMSGASVGQDLLARSFGRTRAGDPIDLEFGAGINLAGAPGANGFTYLRYNADLSPKALSTAGIVDPVRQRRLRKLDAVDCIPQLQDLGRRVGARIGLQEHFEGFL